MNRKDSLKYFFFFYVSERHRWAVVGKLAASDFLENFGTLR